MNVCMRLLELLSFCGAAEEIYEKAEKTDCVLDRELLCHHHMVTPGTG